MSDYNFNDGDKVKCIKSSRFPEYGLAGEIYTVVGSVWYSGKLVLVDLEGLHKGSLASRFELFKEKPFDVLKALREGKKVRRKGWDDYAPHATDIGYYELDKRNSTCFRVVNNKGQHLNTPQMSQIFKEEDWYEYEPPRKKGLYWTVREGCDYDDVSEWNGDKWVIPATNIPVTVIKIGNKIEGPNYDS